MKKFAHFLQAIALIASALATVPAQAQDYPARPVRLVVGLAPGG
jgi:tripartite-type tricarboxylate transporter receptor subunit TctC